MGGVTGSLGESFVDDIGEGREDSQPSFLNVVHMLLMKYNIKMILILSQFVQLNIASHCDFFFSLLIVEDY